MSPEKAHKEFGWQLQETTTAEDDATFHQKMLGDACKELREAYGIPRNAMAAALRIDAMKIAELEIQCSSAAAKKYRAAVNKLIRGIYKPKP